MPDPKPTAAVSWPARAQAPADATSFREVFQAHAAYVLTLLHRLGVSPDDVDDVAQEVFLTVHRKLDSFEGRSTLKTWISGICVRKAREQRRQRARRQARFVAAALEDTAGGHDTEAKLAQQEEAVFLERALNQLSDEQRAVFVLYEIEELGMAEVAQVLGCPRFTAYTRLHAARRRMRAIFQRARAQGRVGCR